MLVKNAWRKYWRKLYWWCVWLILCMIAIIYFTLLHQTKTNWSLSVKFNSSQRSWFFWCFTSWFFWKFFQFLTGWSTECLLKTKGKLQFFLHVFSTKIYVNLQLRYLIIYTIARTQQLFSSLIFYKILWNFKIAISKSCIYLQMVLTTNLKITVLLQDWITLKTGLM